MATPKSDLPQGTLDLLVLQVLTLEPLHGYAIAQRLKQLSRDVVQVTQGTLYPALHRLDVLPRNGNHRIRAARRSSTR
jgi:DNA-binding PadR family transcriptional regulator